MVEVTFLILYVLIFSMSTYAFFISSKLRGELGLKITPLQIVYIVQNEILSDRSVINQKLISQFIYIEKLNLY